MTCDDEVKSQIPETDWPKNVAINFDAEPYLSSIRGLNWNLSTENLIVCRGTE